MEGHLTRVRPAREGYVKLPCSRGVQPPLTPLLPQRPEPPVPLLVLGVVLPASAGRLGREFAARSLGAA